MVGVIGGSDAHAAAGDLSLRAGDSTSSHIADLCVRAFHATHSAVFAVELWVDAESVAAGFPVPFTGMLVVTATPAHVVTTELFVRTLLVYRALHASVSLVVAVCHSRHICTVCVVGTPWRAVLVRSAVLPRVAVGCTEAADTHS